MALTVEWNGVPALYLGVLTSVDILIVDSFRNSQVALTEQQTTLVLSRNNAIIVFFSNSQENICILYQ